LPERLPVGSIADGFGQLWREWRAKRKPVILYPYVDLNGGWRKFARLVTPLVLILFCFIYGFFFALTAPVLIVPFTAPVLLLALLSIWALPETDHVPVKTLEMFFGASLFGLILWPNYLALTLPGLPWITISRLTLFPAAFVLLFSLSSSKNFRKRVSDSADGVPVVFPLLIMFAANSLVSLPLSHAVGSSLNKIIVEQFTWTAMFVAGLYVFSRPRRSERYVTFVVLMGPPMAFLAFQEFEEQHVLWLKHVPSFLKVPDPAVQIALGNQIRSATGQYRAKTTFASPLGLAEYISMLTPFALHWVAGRYPILKRLIGLAMLPTIYIVVRMTDSRLGILGYLVSIVAYVLIWSLVRFRRRINDLTAAIVVYAYPAALIAVLGASLVVHKIHVLIFGGGATSASNADRQAQFLRSLPSFIRNPFGYGANQAAGHMGYGADDFFAIDSYWIRLSLDYGALGMVLFVGIFAVVIYAAVKTLLKHPEVARGETNLLLPLISFLGAFLVIRGVYAEENIQPLVFAVLGMTACLVSRAKQSIAAAAPAPVAPALPASGRGRGGPPVEEAKKPMGFGSVVLIMLGCAVAYYVACVVWRLVH
jgi:hypothetical protein